MQDQVLNSSGSILKTSKNQPTRALRERTAREPAYSQLYLIEGLYLLKTDWINQ
jgi:hypothetical protein